MTLFNEQARVPLVHDINQNGSPDLLVNGANLFRATSGDKRLAPSWQRIDIGDTTWPMTVEFLDVDQDADEHLVVADRNGQETLWFEHPESHPLARWKAHVIDPQNRIRFMRITDLNLDGRADLILTTQLRKSLTILQRLNDHGPLRFRRLEIAQASGDFPKGLHAADFDLDGKPQIFVLPKRQGDHLAEGEPKPGDIDFEARILNTPGAKGRPKMDNAEPVDMVGDGDLDIVTTEENGGWGVIWFENPLYE